MKKLISAVILHALLLPVLNAQSKYFDRPVQLKTCNISISANNFIATTFIEMEFYNSNDSVVEGRQSFRLNKGQVITAFQLDLNGKYRDGSIEEKWKARNAYNSIVGKRIDPAILQMTYDNNYTINIYPIPAHGSRKVTMTIDQLMKQQNGNVSYELPLNFSSLTEQATVNIQVNTNGVVPVCDGELLHQMEFTGTSTAASLKLVLQKVRLNKNILFNIPVAGQKPFACFSKNRSGNDFLLQVSPTVPEYYKIEPKLVQVFWDASTTAKRRDLKKEVAFLEEFIKVNNIERTRITFFNQKILNTIEYNRCENNFELFKTYLLAYPYAGATNLGGLDLAAVKADFILLFSDGVNSVGKSKPTAASVPVSCITSVNYTKVYAFTDIISNSGGSLVDLTRSTINSAVRQIVWGRNWLIGYKTGNNGVKIYDEFPKRINESILLSGGLMGDDQLSLIYGNSNIVNKIENISLSASENCSQENYRKFRLLKSYDSIMQRGSWQEMVIFGLREKVVTPQTAFLVLERIEDYIKYNIAPPSELAEECAARNYVYKSEYKIKAVKTFSAREKLEETANNYNEYVKWWSPEEPLIDLDGSYEVPDRTTSSSSGKPLSTPIPIPLDAVIQSSQNMIKEVIVTSAFQTKRTMRSQSSNIQLINAEQLNTVRTLDINNALAGKVAGMQVRSQSGVAVGRVGSVRIRGENGLGVGKGPIYVIDGQIFDDPSFINTDDVEDITVLQGPAACALFGPDGINGAIVVNSRKGKRYGYNYSRWRNYKLKNIEDVDYLITMNQYEKADVWQGYVELERLHRGEPGFYYDMADFFFQKKMPDKAVDILYEGIECCGGTTEGLRAAAYILESRKMFKEAIDIY